MSASTAIVAAPLLVGHHTSLMHGWVPITVQAVAAVALVLAVGWRSRRWRLVWLPVAAAVGIAVTCWAYWQIADDGLAGEPAPRTLWMWIALTGVAAAVLLLGWPGARWWRRVASVVAVPLCLASSALVLNEWVGYFPTVQTAWNQLTAGPLPDQTDAATVTAMAGKGVRPPRGSVVQVTIPADASHFKHRGELVYLPPAWFASNPPPRLPARNQSAGVLTSPPPTTATRRCWCSSTPAGHSTTTPNASTAAAAMPLIISLKMLCHTWFHASESALSGPTGASWAGRWAARARWT